MSITSFRRALSGAIVALFASAALPLAAWAAPTAYTFKALAIIPGPAPGGGHFDLDFEPYNFDNDGNSEFVADLNVGGTDVGEGIFVERSGRLLQVTREGMPAPGGGTFATIIGGGTGGLGRTSLNEQGDGAFGFILAPFDPNKPIGFNGGLYRFSLRRPEIDPVVIPGQTLAPTGGAFAGLFFNTSINNRGDLLFGGIAPGLQLAGGPGYKGFGTGLFMADRHQGLSRIVIPGDRAPGGGVFDVAVDGSVNDRRQIAFDAHVKGEACVNVGNILNCGSSVYARAPNGELSSVAHQGARAPGGGTYATAFGPVINASGDIAFIGDLTASPNALQSLGVFRSSNGRTLPVARPGDRMPGGGNVVTASQFPYQYSINDRGDIGFVVRLDTDVNHDGVGDTGLYVLSDGVLRLVARTGTVVSGVGRIAHINAPVLANSGFSPFIFSGGILNDRGQILFEATLDDQKTGVLLEATPHDEADVRIRTPARSAR